MLLEELDDFLVGVPLQQLEFGLRRVVLEVGARLGQGALAKLGIATVTAVYDGEGDSGQIDSITAHGADGTERPLEGDILVGDQPPEAIHEALDAFFWDCLTAYHDGFENNDGGYGEITIDVATASVTIEHNQRFTDIDSSSQEI